MIRNIDLYVQIPGLSGNSTKIPKKGLKTYKQNLRSFRSDLYGMHKDIVDDVQTQNPRGGKPDFHLLFLFSDISVSSCHLVCDSLPPWIQQKAD